VKCKSNGTDKLTVEDVSAKRSTALAAGPAEKKKRAGRHAGDASQECDSAGTDGWRRGLCRVSPSPEPTSTTENPTMCKSNGTDKLTVEDVSAKRSTALAAGPAEVKNATVPVLMAGGAVFVG
jgi:hypothetical protein